jgi:hypothetical protein
VCVVCVFPGRCSQPPLIFRTVTIQTTAPSVLGFAGFEAMDVLFKVDPRFKRVYERNYFMLLIAWVKYSVPFLM